MAEPLAAGTPSRARPLGGALRPLDHVSSFRVIYGSVFAFALLYIFSVEAAESLLDAHFRSAVAEAVEVSPVDGPLQPQIQNRLTELLVNSPWVELGGVRVNITVLGADGRTPLYLGGTQVVPPPPEPTLEAAMRAAVGLLPPITDVFVSVTHGSVLSTSILIIYAALLLQGLFLHNRSMIRREQAEIAKATSARDDAARRAQSIEEELDRVQDRMRTFEPADAHQSEEIRQLESEREGLRRQLRVLAQRETELLAGAVRATELEEERQTLEELLDEALGDVGQKEQEIADLQDRLKYAAKKPAPQKGKGRESERIAKRLRTLYKNIEVDDRAVSDLAALGDESLKLRAEEGLKRLADDPDTAAVRRKVGGLPPQLAIYELGFAGKGRIYYARTEAARYRILAVGGKATQKQDLEYLSRLSL
jgi:plasmid stabilization system protein ParE